MLPPSQSIFVAQTDSVAGRCHSAQALTSLSLSSAVSLLPPPTLIQDAVRLSFHGPQ